MRPALQYLTNEQTVGLAFWRIGSLYLNWHVANEDNSNTCLHQILSEIDLWSQVCFIVPHSIPHLKGSCLP